MMKTRFRVVVDRERCKGCELCIPVCPRQLLALSSVLNGHGCHYPLAQEGKDCIGCLKCTVMCPEAAIEIEVMETAHDQK